MRSIFLISFLFVINTPACAKYLPLHSGEARHAIIFIHGLMGDPIVSFKNDKSEDSWADLLAKDQREMRAGPPLSDYTIGALGFPAGSTDKLSIVQIANRLQTDLVDEGIFDNHDHIFLIAHSLGGLVAKEIFNNLKILSKEKSDKLTGIFLISTPSQGSDASKLIADLPEILKGPLITDSQPIEVNTYLQSLEATWQNHLRQRKARFPRVYCAYETKMTSGVLVVPMAYTATRCDETPRPENEDHSSIVRPQTTEDSIYRWVRGRIAATLRIAVDDEGLDMFILININGGAVELTTTHPVSMIFNMLEGLQNLQNNPLDKLNEIQNKQFSVISGTKIKILEYPPETDKRIPTNKLGKYVEILEGEHKGRKGWVSKGNIQRKTAD